MKNCLVEELYTRRSKVNYVWVVVEECNDTLMAVFETERDAKLYVERMEAEELDARSLHDGDLPLPRPIDRAIVKCAVNKYEDFQERPWYMATIDLFTGEIKTKETNIYTTAENPEALDNPATEDRYSGASSTISMEDAINKAKSIRKIWLEQEICKMEELSQ